MRPNAKEHTSLFWDVVLEKSRLEAENELYER